MTALPLPRTPLIGREHELAKLGALVQDAAVPLVTVTGPGGVGKMRLALQVTANVGAFFGDGVAFVPLADLRDPGLLLPTIVRSLSLEATDAGSARDWLVSHLGSRRFLLVLDNLDQVLPLLTDGARDQPERLRTMRAAIAWSYDLLEPEDQRLFRRLSVFVGGFELPGAVAVAGGRWER